MEIRDDSGGGAAVDSPKGVCLYHGQGGGAASYNVTNVLYFGLDENGLVVTNEGADADAVRSEQLGQLAYMMYERYNSGIDDISAGDYVGSMIFALINDGYIGVDSSFFQNNQSNVSYIKNPSGAAVAYGSNSFSFKAISVNNLADTKIVSHDANNGDTILGPFSVSYGAKGLDNIVLNPMNEDGSWRKNNLDDKGYISWSTDMQTWKDGTTIGNETDGIKSNTPFYIKVSDMYEEYNKASKIQIDYIQKDMQYIRAKLVFAKSDGYAQQIAFFAADSQNYTGNASQTITVTPNVPVDLTVVKTGDNNVSQPNVSFNLLNGVAGKAHAHWGNMTEENGVNIYSDITFKEWTNEDNQAFKTGSSGKLIIKGLDPSYTYSIQETYNPNPGYSTIDIKDATLSNNTANVKLSSTENKTNKNQVTDIKLNSTQNNQLYIIDRNEKKDYFNIDINKTDLSGKSNVEGAEFRIKIYDGIKAIGWLSRTTTGEYKYDSQYKESTIWSTTVDSSDNDLIVYANSKGKISITGLSKEYRYQIYETKQASGYMELRYQIPNGMKVEVENKQLSELKFIEAQRESTEANDYAPTDDSIYCTTVSYSGNGTDVNIAIRNYKRIKTPPSTNDDDEKIKISGLIWVDKEIGKNHEYNDIYESSNEELYKGNVKISVINSNGKTIKTVETNTGEYTIQTDIAISDSASKKTVADKLSGYYLKFEYDSNYSTVAPRFTDENGSKALIKDEDGEAFIYNLDEYVESFYSNYTLQHMNLGLVETPIADYTVSQSIAYVKVVINGYTYTYEYAGKAEEASTAAPTVEFSNGNAYERPIYPSDIAYSIGRWSDSNSLKVYVVYRIDITNSNTTNYNTDRNTIDKKIDYVEIDMKLTSLINNYDKDTYVLETDYDSSENADFANWKDDNNEGKATYTGDKLNNPILPNRTRTIYNQYRVKDEALEELLSTEERAEKVMTTATSTAYHDYWKSYYTWSSEGGEPILATADRQTSKLQKEAKAYYLKLKLTTERTISGLVFKDDNIYGATGEIIGSGFYDDNESRINNVKVELLTEDGQKAYLYNKESNFEEKSADITSGIDGTYSFIGVTPGKYYIKFTYGDGTQKVCTINEDGTYSQTETSISIEDYKSTIVSDSFTKAAFGYEDINFTFENQKDKENWYKKIKNLNYNVAVDDLEQRANYNKDNKSSTDISAKTPLSSISIENTSKDYITITKEENGTKEKISGINFGIIEIPRIKLAFDKVVSNIQITNSQGNIIAEGNPALKNMDIVSNLDFGNHLVEGSNFVRAEINEQELYGSELKLEYSVTIQNNSDLNYYEDADSKYFGYYYKFGDYSDSYSKEVTITTDEVLDFLDPSTVYVDIDNEHQVDQIKATDYQKITESIQSITGLTYENILKITRKIQEPIYTTEKTEIDGSMVYDKEKTQKTAIFTVYKLLSSDQNDLGVTNVAQAIKLHVTDEPALVEKIEFIGPEGAIEETKNTRFFGDSNPTEEVSVIITPPTGIEFNVVAYIIIGISILVIFTGAILIIKNKIFNKR